MESGLFFSPVAVMVVGVVAVAILAMTFSILRNRRPSQEWEHLERMKALEMGISLPPRDSSCWPRAVVAIAIGAVVPLGTFFCALLTTVSTSLQRNQQFVVWGVAFLVSTTAIGCATSLAPGRPDSSDRPEESLRTAKPPGFDPESFEAVVASRHD